MAAIREDGAEPIEVHVAGACVRHHEGRWQLLAGQRTELRSLYPGKWECGGGQVRRGEDFRAAIQRQIFEEFGLAVTPIHMIETYSIHVPNEQRIIPGLRFLCLASAGAVRLCNREFSRFEWLDLPPPDKEWIPGLQEVLDGITPEYLDRVFSVPTPAAKQPPGFVPPETQNGGE